MAYSRRFGFFDKVPLNFDKTGNILENVPISCVTSGRGYLWLGDEDGFMHCIDTNLRISSFRAHETAIRNCLQAKNADLLVTISSDNQLKQVLCVWNTKKWSLMSKTASPICCKTLNLSPVGNIFDEVTCLQISENLDCILLGHSSGSVNLVKGNLTSDRQFRRSTLYEFTSAVTGLCFAQNRKSKTKGYFPPSVEMPTLPSPHSSKKRTARISEVASLQDLDALLNTIVFASCESTLVRIVYGKIGELISTTTLENFGCLPNCSCLLVDLKASMSARLLMAHKDAVYLYDTDGRGPCFAIDGDKRFLSAYNNYIVAIKNGSFQRVSSTDNSQSPAGFPNLHSRVTIFDFKSKFFAADFEIPWAHSIITDWGGLFIVSLKRNSLDSSDCASVQIFELVEKDAQTKLEILLEKKAFNLAIEIAELENLGPEKSAQIHRRCADHLFSQKKYDDAVKEYIQTIGIVEASYVVLRFLESGLISQLVRYLEELHEPQNSKFLNKDHTALLFNSYARLDDEEGIEIFLAKLKTRSNCNEGFISSINVLRHAGYYKQALRLAELVNSPNDSIRILIEDQKNAEAALEKINNLPFEQSLNAICIHGSFLMKTLPTPTAELLHKLCSNPKAGLINVEHFLKIFVNNRAGLMQFLMRYLRKPESSVDSVSGIVETLLELLLYEADTITTGSTPDANQVKELHELAMNLLQSPHLHYDAGKVLVICHRRKFLQGCLSIWEDKKQYDQILEHYMLQNDLSAVLSTCERFGKESPQLWLEALKFVADKPSSGEYLARILSEIEGNDLAPPLIVLKILTSVEPTKCCKLGNVKTYLLKYLQSGKQKVDMNQKEIKLLREETLKNREIIRLMKTRVKIFQQQNCAVCKQNLEPPSVHFLCDHSFHKSCFDTYSREVEQCPECAPMNRHLLAQAEKAAVPLRRSGSNNISVDQLDQLKNALILQQKLVSDQSQNPNSGHVSQFQSHDVLQNKAPPHFTSPFSGIVRDLIGQGAMQSPSIKKTPTSPQKSTSVARITPTADDMKKPPIDLNSIKADSGIASNIGSTIPALSRVSVAPHSQSSTRSDWPSSPGNPFDTEYESVASQRVPELSSPIPSLSSQEHKGTKNPYTMSSQRVPELSSPIPSLSSQRHMGTKNSYTASSRRVPELSSPIPSLSSQEHTSTKNPYTASSHRVPELSSPITSLSSQRHTGTKNPYTASSKESARNPFMSDEEDIEADEGEKPTKLDDYPACLNPFD